MLAIIIQILGPRSYLCQELGGNLTYHRHVNQIHKCTQNNAPLVSGAAAAVNNDSADSQNISLSPNNSFSNKYPEFGLDLSADFATSALLSISSALPTAIPSTHTDNHTHSHNHTPVQLTTNQNKLKSNINSFTPIKTKSHLHLQQRIQFSKTK